jgi:hypothetical protein
MNHLAENAIAIWMGGAVLFTMAGVVYWQLRTGKALSAMLAVVIVTGMLLVVEHLLETPREAVERTLHELADAIEANDLPGVLTFIVPAANEVRTDAESLMPLVNIKKANIMGTPSVTVDDTTQPPMATVNCQGFVDLTIRQNGVHGGYMDRVTIHFVAEGDRWLIESYTPARDWHRSASGGRP